MRAVAGCSAWRDRAREAGGGGGGRIRPCHFIGSGRSGTVSQRDASRRGRLGGEEAGRGWWGIADRRQQTPVPRLCFHARERYVLTPVFLLPSSPQKQWRPVRGVRGGWGAWSFMGTLKRKVAPQGGESDIVATPDGRIHPLGSTYRVRGDLQGVERPSIGWALCGAAAPRGSWGALNRPLTPTHPLHRVACPVPCAAVSPPVPAPRSAQHDRTSHVTASHARMSWACPPRRARPPQPWSRGALSTPLHRRARGRQPSSIGRAWRPPDGGRFPTTPRPTARQPPVRSGVAGQSWRRRPPHTNCACTPL